MAAKTPKPLEIKRFYILLALAREPLHGYALHSQVLADSTSALYIDFGSLYRLLGQLVRGGLVEIIRKTPGEGPVRQVYALTSRGRSRLKTEAGVWWQTARLARERLP